MRFRPGNLYRPSAYELSTIITMPITVAVTDTTIELAM